MVKSLVRKTSASIFLIAFILQVLALSTPGWLIYVHGNIVEYNGLFYRRTCETENLGETELETCKTESLRFLHLYRRKILLATRASKAELALEDLHYNTRVCQQVLIAVSTGLSLLVVIVQGIQIMKKHKDNMQLLLLAALASATSGIIFYLTTFSAGIVTAVVSNEVIDIHYETEVNNHDHDQANTYIGIPYCLAMLAVSALLHFLADICLSFQLYRPRITKSNSRVEVNDISKVPQETRADDWDWNDTTELGDCMETKPDICNESTVLHNGGIDNPVYTERL